ITVAIMILFISASCATKSENIKGYETSPMMYQAYSCDQLNLEYDRICRQLTSVCKQQDESANLDAVAMTIGMIIFWPALFALAATDDEKHQISKLKGEKEAIEVAMSKCEGFQKVEIKYETRQETKQESFNTINGAGELKTSNYIPAMSGLTTANVKVNEKEPWTGKWKVDSVSQLNGIWAMKQEGKTVKSIKSSHIGFKGKIQGNQLKGKVDIGIYLPFIVEISSDGMSFKGSLDYFGNIQYILKGNRIE
ncbi:MAG: hypothetical protein ABFS12_16935, partial [Bacteroidota bacterium]